MDVEKKNDALFIPISLILRLGTEMMTYRWGQTHNLGGGSGHRGTGVRVNGHHSCGGEP